MFILSLTYLKGNDEADKHMGSHMAWVKEGYARGWFLASGRKVPRTGGVIFARGEQRNWRPMSLPTPLPSTASPFTKSRKSL